jgi:hypothetical protein
VIVHIAIFKWKDTADKAAVDQAIDAIRRLEEKIEDIEEIAVGINASRYSEGFTHVVLVRGRTQAAIDAYRAHPEHQTAAAIIEAAEERGIGVDFDTGAWSPSVG